MSNMNRVKSKNLVILEKEEDVSLINLNDKDSFNSLSEDLLKELLAALNKADKDDSTRVIILKGAGRGFVI